ncbi:hypothetical protein S7711_11138 [Stachybotrys chartarum IBT 7711]|uniref:Uncharacterized protein n=1 Tax=Stachybotrys chartarum (strain CBS 109288 / IBT 7711) TaxID=1280523 RepID=A0A084BA25_STACB|nr:hypothetical protein S7711_11138 [Stachybotrys chartarum IBT 7711]
MGINLPWLKLVRAVHAEPGSGAVDCYLMRLTCSRAGRNSIGQFADELQKKRFGAAVMEVTKAGIGDEGLDDDNAKTGSKKRTISHDEVSLVSQPLGDSRRLKERIPALLPARKSHHIDLADQNSRLTLVRLAELRLNLLLEAGAVNDINQDQGLYVRWAKILATLEPNEPLALVIKAALPL